MPVRAVPRAMPLSVSLLSAPQGEGTPSDQPQQEGPHRRQQQRCQTWQSRPLESPRGLCWALQGRMRSPNYPPECPGALPSCGEASAGPSLPHTMPGGLIRALLGPIGGPCCPLGAHVPKSRAAAEHQNNERVEMAARTEIAQVNLDWERKGELFVARWAHETLGETSRERCPIQMGSWWRGGPDHGGHHTGHS